jgi:hypothetical protein
METSSGGYGPTSGGSSFYKSVKSYSSKAGGHGAGDISLQQISEAKEVFGDMESAYRRFKYEIEELKKEHGIEVSQIWFYFTSFKGKFKIPQC